MAHYYIWRFQRFIQSISKTLRNRPGKLVDLSFLVTCFYFYFLQFSKNECVAIVIYIRQSLFVHSYRFKKIATWRLNSRWQVAKESTWRIDSPTYLYSEFRNIEQFKEICHRQQPNGKLQLRERENESGYNCWDIKGMWHNDNDPSTETSLHLLNLVMFISGSDCYYDNEKGKRYMGRKSDGYTSGGRRCVPWTWQTRYPDSWFPDGSRSAAGKYCRNGGGVDRPWCYYNTNYDWVYCRVGRCRTYSNTALTQLHIMRK